MAQTKVRILDGNQLDIFGTNNDRVVGIKVNSNNILIIATGTNYTSLTTRISLNAVTGLLTIAGISDTNQFLSVDSSGLLTISYKVSQIAENITLQNKESGAGFGTSIQFQLGDGTSNLDAAKFQIIQKNAWTGTAATKDANLVITIAENGTLQERFRINESGNIGITNSKPNQKLDINYGNIGFSGVEPPNSGGQPISAGPGSLTGPYVYKTTFINSAGETHGSPMSASVCVSSNSICISNIPVASAEKNVIARRVYRSGDGLAGFRLAGTITDNSTTTFSDNNTNLTILEPTYNSTAGFIVRDNVKSAFFPQSGGMAVGTGLLPRGAKAGYLYIPSMSGAPSGVATPTYTPNLISQTTPLVYDIENNTLYAFNTVESLWRSTSFF